MGAPDKCCSGSGNAALAPGAAAREFSAVYRIDNMDCPIEEALIRDKLARVPGIARLEFNPIRRELAIDGINDAPALARADVGIAMGAAGTNAAIETADLALMNDDLRKVGSLLRTTRKLLLYLGLAFAIPAVAQTSPGSQKPPFQDPPAAETRSRSTGEQLTLERAWAIAETGNPILQAAVAQLAAAEGQLKDAQAFLWNNPHATSDVTRRRVPQVGAPPETFNEWSVGLAQTFEVAGQRGYRRQAAELDLAATRHRIDEVRAQLRAQVELAFSRVLALRQRIDLERDVLKVVSDAAEVVRKRVNAGEDMRLEGNLAAVEAERGRNQLTALDEQLIQARADLAALLQLPTDAFPEVAGQLAINTVEYSLEELLASAAKRPQLAVLEAREGAARSRLALERASAYPDVTVGIATGRERSLDMRERLATLTVSVPIPLFKRNAGGIGRAASDLAQSQIERVSTARDVQAQVQALWQKLESARSRVTRLSNSVLPALDENRRLSTTAYRAGEIGLVPLLLVNRQLLDARRDYLEAFVEFIQDRIALEQAAGVTGIARAASNIDPYKN